MRQPQLLTLGNASETTYARAPLTVRPRRRRRGDARGAPRQTAKAQPTGQPIIVTRQQTLELPLNKDIWRLTRIVGPGDTGERNTAAAEAASAGPVMATDDPATC